MGTKQTRYTETIASEILARLAEGESLRKICKDDGMPTARSVLRWADEDTKGFRARYERAREYQAHSLFDEMLEIAGSAQAVAHGAPGTGEASAKVQAVKLKVDSMKWYLSKLLPKRYGDRVAMEHTGADGGPIQTAGEFRISEADEEAVKRIAQIREKLQTEQ